MIELIELLHAVWLAKKIIELVCSGTLAQAAQAGDREALGRIRSDAGEGRTFTREELAEAWGISE